MPSAHPHCKLSYFHHFPTSLAPSFSDTCGSLNFLSVHSCSQNLPLISCMSASVRLNFHHWCKTPSSAFSKKFQQRPPIFWNVFIRATSDVQLCFVQLKTLAPSARCSTFKYPVTLKPGLGSLKVIKNYTSRSGTHDFLSTFHSHHRPISHRFRDKRPFLSKITNFSYP